MSKMMRSKLNYFYIYIFIFLFTRSTRTFSGSFFHNKISPDFKFKLVVVLFIFFMTKHALYAFNLGNIFHMVPLFQCAAWNAGNFQLMPFHILQIIYSVINTTLIHTTIVGRSVLFDRV